MRKCLFACLLSLGAIGFAQGPDLNLLHFNDVYEIEPVNSGERGGAARIATLVKARAAANPLILFSGDLFSPSLMSSIFQGSQMVDVFNQLGVDYGVFGNHEFDFGPEVTVQRVSESDFAWLSTNLVDADTGEPYADGVHSALFEWDGVQVGLIGLLGDWLNLTSAGNNAQYIDFLEAAQAEAAALKSQGAEVIIALTHMNMSDDRRLAAAVPELDLILGGHDHAPMHEVVDGTLIWKTGSDFRTLGDLKLYDLSGQKAVILPRYIEVNSSVDFDPDMQTVVDAYAALLDDELGQPVGQSEVELNALRGSVRTEETNYGNLIADAARAFTGADVAFMNGGGIRTDQTYGPGELTRRDVQSVLPFGNVLITIELSGADLLAALEQGVSATEDVAGRFLQVSGLTFVYDPSAAPGSRVLEVSVGGAPLDEAATYVVAVNDFIGGGGDGFDVFVDAPRQLTEAGGPLLVEVVMNYFSENSPVAPVVEGRISTP